MYMEGHFSLNFQYHIILDCFMITIFILLLEGFWLRKQFGFNIGIYTY